MVLVVIEAKEALMNIGIARAKARLSELVNRVAFGNEYIILESRGKPKAALVSLEDLKYVQSAHPARPTRSQRLLALAQADRVRRSLQSRPLVPSSEELSRLRRERIDGLSSTRYDTCRRIGSHGRRSRLSGGS
jgi:prevent-host-death family protein